MRRQPIAESIWDLDPRRVREQNYADFEYLFMAAFESEFHQPASPRLVQPYLQRYFRFRVVPLWVRCYVRTELRGQAIGNIGNAPLDPVLDWRQIWRAIAARLLIASSRPAPKGRRGSFLRA